MLQLMHREWLRPLAGATDQTDIPAGDKPSSRALVVLLFWTYFETLISTYYDAASAHLPDPVAEEPFWCWEQYLVRCRPAGTGWGMYILPTWSPIALIILLAYRWPAYTAWDAIGLIANSLIALRLFTMISTANRIRKQWEEYRAGRIEEDCSGIIDKLV